MARLRPEDLEVSEEERRLARQQNAGAQGGGVGAGIGTAAGAALGALGFFGGPAVGLATVPLGASLGGAIGGAAGSSIGNAQADDASEKLSKLDMERQKKLTEYQLRQQALDALLEES